MALLFLKLQMKPPVLFFNARKLSVLSCISVFLTSLGIHFMKKEICTRNYEETHNCHTINPPLDF